VILLPPLLIQIFITINKWNRHKNQNKLEFLPIDSNIKKVNKHKNIIIDLLIENLLSWIVFLKMQWKDVRKIINSSNDKMVLYIISKVKIIFLKFNIFISVVYISFKSHKYCLYLLYNKANKILILKWMLSGLFKWISGFQVNTQYEAVTYK
jgi:hypothetical protein